MEIGGAAFAFADSAAHDSKGFVEAAAKLIGDDILVGSQLRMADGVRKLENVILCSDVFRELNQLCKGRPVIGPGRSHARVPSMRRRRGARARAGWGGRHCFKSCSVMAHSASSLRKNSPMVCAALKPF